ncbi:hypothetical protein DF185_22720 [Marinifilum breve]|uniref:Uncharacterized protein n=2 Tax=Marinifilum breve TaxID=2184082 RepID=A0A2V3ZRI8_9BACT|nr:hypothetical protein DF185_22720 [Marinifilum breve]
MSLFLFVECSKINSDSLSRSYVLRDKYLGGKISFSDNGKFSLTLNNSLLKKASTGYYSIKGDKIILTSEWQKDTIIVKSEINSSFTSLKIIIKDFNDLPIEGKVIVDKVFEYSFEDGKVIIDRDKWDDLWVLTYNYIDKKVDTLDLSNKNYNSYFIRRMNTFNYPNYLFLDRHEFLLKGSSLIEKSGLLLSEKKLKFISK